MFELTDITTSSQVDPIRTNTHIVNGKGITFYLFTIDRINHGLHRHHNNVRVKAIYFFNAHAAFSSGGRGLAKP